MTERLHNAVYTIPVPAGLNARVLAACRQQAAAPAPAPRVVRLVPAAVAAAACAAVVLTVLLSGGGQTPPPTGSLTAIPGATVPDGDTATPSVDEAAPSNDATSTTTAVTPLTTGDATGVTAPNGTTQTSSKGTDTTTAGGKTTQTTWKGTTATDNQAACELIIPGRFVEMNEQELTAHYGRRFLPTRLPADMGQPHIYGERGIYYKDEAVIATMSTQWEFMLEHGTIRDAEVIYDMNGYYWCSMENSDRNLTVNVSTAPYPSNMLGDLSRFDTLVEVAGITVKLHSYDDAPYSDTWSYSALFTVDGVEFYVSAWEFTREEFLDTLASLLE